MVSDEDDFNQFFSLLNLDEQITFEETNTIKSRIDDNITYKRYMQYYKGIPVIGGGYTAAWVVPSGPAYDPCKAAYKLTPFIMSDIDISVEPLIRQSDLTGVLENATNYDSALKIVFNHNNNCNYRLIWEVNTKNNIAFYIDANTGEILSENSNTLELNAPTVDYGTQDLDDTVVGDRRYMISEDGRVKTYNFGTSVFAPGEGELPFVHWDDEFIISQYYFPTTPQWVFNTNRKLSQVHFATTTVLPKFDELGIEFGEVRSTHQEIGSGTKALPESTMDLTYIVYKGDTFSNASYNPTTALFDVVAHELSHIYLIRGLGIEKIATSFTNNSIHEGICDVVGTYIESTIPSNNGIDWQMGDDSPGIMEMLNRDLSDPKCINNTPVEDGIHQKGLVLGHWYYLLAEGDTESIGMLPALNILLESLNHVEGLFFYNELMNATLLVTEEFYGYCSPEYSTVVRSWEAVCVNTGVTLTNGRACNFSLTGSYQFDEEVGLADFSVEGGEPGATAYRFSISGNQSTEFESLHGMVGNSQNGSSSLYLISFPTFPYYPQYFKLKCRYIPENITVIKRFKIADPNGDKPKCQEYHGDLNADDEILLSRGYSPSTDYLYLQNDNKTLNVDLNGEIHIFDMYGKVLYKGKQNQFVSSNIIFNGIGIIVLYNENGQRISTKKIYINN